VILKYEYNYNENLQYMIACWEYLYNHSFLIKLKLFCDKKRHCYRLHYWKYLSL